jgi:hypothetical protein
VQPPHQQPVFQKAGLYTEVPESAGPFCILTAPEAFIEAPAAKHNIPGKKGGRQTRFVLRGKEDILLHPGFIRGDSIFKEVLITRKNDPTVRMLPEILHLKRQFFFFPQIIGIQKGLEPDTRGWCLFIEE